MASWEHEWMIIRSPTWPTAQSTSAHTTKRRW